jgi:hypothetical protein
VKHQPDTVRIINRVKTLPQPKRASVERIFRDADGSTWTFYKSEGRFRSYDIQAVRTISGLASMSRCGFYDSWHETMDSVIEKEMLK